MADGLAGCVTEREGAAIVRVKVVPGASGDRIAGPLGGRLKVRVAAPPEGGKANRAVCRLIAAAVGVPERDVSVVAGHTRPQKAVAIEGVSRAAAIAGLAGG